MMVHDGALVGIGNSCFSPRDAREVTTMSRESRRGYAAKEGRFRSVTCIRKFFTAEQSLAITITWDSPESSRSKQLSLIVPNDCPELTISN